MCVDINVLEPPRLLMPRQRRVRWLQHPLFFFKQKTAYEIMSGDWSSDVCSSD
eukprot:COSAG02_NODE_47209_length_343_cov_0.237705_1_plen_52_part_10